METYSRKYNPELIYIQGSASSRLDIIETNNPIKPNISSLAEHFSLEKKDVLNPINYKSIMQYQQNDKSLIETAKSNKDYSIKFFIGQIRNILLFVEIIKL